MILENTNQVCACSFCSEEHRFSEKRSYVLPDVKSLWLLSHESCCIFNSKACYPCSCPRSHTGAQSHTIFFLKHKFIHTEKEQYSKKQPCLNVKVRKSGKKHLYQSSVIQALKVIVLGSLVKMGKRVLSCSSTPSHFSSGEKHRVGSAKAHRYTHHRHHRSS